jgi:hypothetical protein
MKVRQAGKERLGTTGRKPIKVSQEGYDTVTSE